MTTGAPASSASVIAQVRPWGSYMVLGRGAGYQVKRLTVSPGRRTSLQWHRHRDEHWTIVQGECQATRGEWVFNLGLGQTISISKAVPHRVRNPSASEALEIIEVQVGDYLEEDDIVRIEDDYGRAGL